MERSARAAASGLAAVLLVSLSGGAASGADPSDPTSCPGVVATGPTSYRLTADLDDCWVTRDPGLPPISIDLGGHTWSKSFISLTKAGSRLANGSLEGSTVWLAGALDHVTVRNVHSFAVEAFDLLRVTESTFESNQVGLSAYFGSAAVTRSAFRGNGLGFVVGRGSGSSVERSEFGKNDLGVFVWDEDLVGSDDVVVRHNHFSDNAAGIRVTAVTAVARATIADNQVDESDGPGIDVTVLCDPALPCGGQGTLIEGNHLRHNGLTAATPDAGDGIRVRGEENGTGAPLDPTWVTLSANQSDRNAALGIDAPGVSDGGKNRAKFNGDPRQCVGVDCGGPAPKHGPKKKNAGGAP